jgi:rubrerythrin
MKSIKGTRTEKNLLGAFAGESQARNRYTYFAAQAQKEGFEQIAAIFTETADQERIHAKNFFKQLEGGEVEITAAFPAGVIGTTLENLKASAAGEHHEQSDLYPAFAKVAKEEGFDEIARLFLNVANAELGHEQRYEALAKLVEEGKVFKRGEKVRWRCRKCGFTHEGLEAAGKCPACGHPQAYFEVLGEHY